MSLSSVPPTDRSPPDTHGQHPLPDDGSRSGVKRTFGLSHWLAFLGMVTMGLGTLRIVSFTVSDWIFVCAVLALMFELLVGRRRKLAPVAMRRSPPLILLGTLLILLGGTFSTLLSTDPSSSMGYVPRLGWLTLVWFWLLRSVCPDYPSMARLVNGFKIAVIIGSVAAMLSSFGIVEFNQLVGIYDTREAGLFKHPNSFSGFLIAGLPLFLLDVPRSPSRPQGRPLIERVLFSSIPLIALGTSGSLSAAAASLVGFALVGCLAMFIRSRTRPLSPLRVVGVIVAIGMGILLLLGIDNPIAERFSRWERGESHLSESVNSRGEHVEHVVDNIESLLLIGNGFGPEAAGNDDFTTAARGVHNMYLRILYEGGMITLLGVILVFFEAIREAGRLLLYTRNTYMFTLTLALMGAMIASFARASFQPTLTDRYFWLPIAFIGVLWSICRREAMRPSTPTVVSSTPLS